MQSSALTPAPALDPAGRLADDLPCASCAYNLRGLLPESTCPECGLPIGRSIRGDLLHFADPRWIDRLAQAMTWAIAAIVLGVFCMVPLIFLNPDSPIHWMIAMCIIGIPTIIGLIACLLFTTAEPRTLEHEPANSPRRVARAAAFVLVGLVLIELTLEIRFVARPILDSITLLGIITATIGVAAAGRYAAQLAARVPDPSLAKQTRFVGHGCAFVGTLVAGGAVIHTLQTAGISLQPTLNARGMHVVYWSALALGGLTALAGFAIFGLWTLMLIWRFTKVLATSAAIARRTWARA